MIKPKSGISEYGNRMASDFRSETAVSGNLRLCLSSLSSAFRTTLFWRSGAILSSQLLKLSQYWPSSCIFSYVSSHEIYSVPPPFTIPIFLPSVSSDVKFHSPGWSKRLRHKYSNRCCSPSVHKPRKCPVTSVALCAIIYLDFSFPENCTVKPLVAAATTWGSQSTTTS